MLLAEVGGGGGGRRHLAYFVGAGSKAMNQTLTCKGEGGGGRSGVHSHYDSLSVSESDRWWLKYFCPPRRVSIASAKYSRQNNNSRKDFSVNTTY
jgi:hypothetical protein